MRRALGPWLLAIALFPTPAAAQGAWSARLVGPRARVELASPEAELRIEGARTLGHFGEPRRAVAALLDALETEDDLRVRPAIFEALARRGDGSAVPRLAAKLGDFGREDRAAALRTIGAIGGESAIRVLIEWLGASDVGTDAEAALVWIGAPAVPHLLRALRAPLSLERAAHALGAIGDTRATPALVAAMDRAPPSSRIALLDALGELGDERAAPTVAGALSDPVPGVVEAALRALGRVGSAPLPETLVVIAERGIREQRAIALDALAVLDPELAAPRLERALDGSTDALVRRAAARAAIDHPSRALVPVLASLAGDPAHRAAAADALARVPSGAGIDALVELADPVALALAVRRHRALADGGAVERALGVVRADPSLRGAVLAALARDESALPRLSEALAAPDPLDRARAALGLALLGRAPSEHARIAERLAREHDPRAFRALALAATALGVPADAVRIDAHFDDPETAPEALWLAAGSLRDAPSRTQRRVRRAMREALREPDPRVRAGAALALARAFDRSAWRAIAAILDDEHDAVRLAAAHALASLAVPESLDAVAARERVEPSAAVRVALRSVPVAVSGRSPPAFVRGDETLSVRVVTAPGLRPRSGTIDVDVLLSDGRWLRTFALSGGEVLVPSAPGGEAEVHVRL